VLTDKSPDLLRTVPRAHRKPQACLSAGIQGHSRPKASCFARFQGRACVDRNGTVAHVTDWTAP